MMSASPDILWIMDPYFKAEYHVDVDNSSE